MKSFRKWLVIFINSSMEIFIVIILDRGQQESQKVVCIVLERNSAFACGLNSILLSGFFLLCLFCDVIVINEGKIM